MIISVSGAGGRMGSLVAGTVAVSPDLELGPLYDPHHSGAMVAGQRISDDPASIAGADVVVEFTEPDVVMENLATWRSLGLSAVVGTSGFDADRVARLRTQWGSGPPNCLVVPNFSIGAVVMMRLAEIAAPHFAAAEVIELHHDRKVDAPSGTAIATAERISNVASQSRAVQSTELLAGARGADVAGVPVHAVRLPGLVAHQLVLFGGPGEMLTIRHDTTDRTAFMPGVLAAVRAVADLEDSVTVGLESILGV
ncbi:MAG: 4-hydroxy-tetrahydrodipicolinate reductase [Actinomycetia bacterium]|nr:4-hydroxy-tetrahydrodipicolinate reductase [Actinomycetes bacterium]